MSTDPVLLISKNREFNNYLKTHKISSLDHICHEQCFWCRRSRGGDSNWPTRSSLPRPRCCDLPGPVYPDLAVLIHQVPSTTTSLLWSTIPVYPDLAVLIYQVPSTPTSLLWSTRSCLPRPRCCDLPGPVYPDLAVLIHQVPAKDHNVSVRSHLTLTLWSLAVCSVFSYVEYKLRYAKWVC